MKIWLMVQTCLFLIVPSKSQLEDEDLFINLPQITCYACTSDTRREQFPLCDDMHWYTLTTHEKNLYLVICMTGCVKVIHYIGKKHRITTRGCGRNCNIFVEKTCPGYDIGCGWHSHSNITLTAEEEQAEDEEELTTSTVASFYDVGPTVEAPPSIRRSESTYTCVCDTDLCNRAPTNFKRHFITFFACALGPFLLS